MQIGRTLSTDTIFPITTTTTNTEFQRGSEAVLCVLCFCGWMWIPNECVYLLPTAAIDANYGYELLGLSALVIESLFCSWCTINPLHK